MKKIQINELFTNYLNDREKGLEPLLEAIRRKALLKFKDEDATQDFLISIWELLPTLTEEVEGKRGGGFKSFVEQRLRWVKLNNKRDASRKDAEYQLPELFEDDGEPISTQDTVDLLQFKEVSWQELGCERGIEEVGYKELDDEFLQEVANMLLTGKSLDQIALTFRIGREYLQQKVARHLNSTKKLSKN